MSTRMRRVAGWARATARKSVESLGQAAYDRVDKTQQSVTFLGSAAYLLWDALAWLGPTLLRREATLVRGSIAAQMVRVGVRSIPIIVLVQVFIGIILALQMAPTLEAYGQLERVADIVAIAVFRELGPLITAIVLSGFAGASIAAELGAMVEGEEVKALRAMALNPVQWLVVPRIVATVIMLTALAVIADVVGVLGGLTTSVVVLGIDADTYLSATRAALKHRDFYTGLVKAGVFGLLIALIACQEGLSVSGGAVGVGRATTATVVKSIVALIGTDCLFTAAFYSLGW